MHIRVQMSYGFLTVCIPRQEGELCVAADQRSGEATRTDTSTVRPVGASAGASAQWGGV